MLVIVINLKSFNVYCKPFLLERICTHDMAAFVLGTSHVNVVVPSIDEATEYDRLYIVTIGGDGAVNSMLLRFGSPPANRRP